MEGKLNENASFVLEIIEELNKVNGDMTDLSSQWEENVAQYQDLVEYRYPRNALDTVHGDKSSLHNHNLIDDPTYNNPYLKKAKVGTVTSIRGLTVRVGSIYIEDSH